MKISELDENKVFNALLRIPLASMHLGHKHIKNTLKDYVETSEGSLESQFIKDLFTLETDEIIEKWYDGKEEATDLFYGVTE